MTESFAVSKSSVFIVFWKRKVYDVYPVIWIAKYQIVAVYIPSG